MRHFVSKPSPALVVAFIALFVGMSGAGYAASKIGSSQIKKNAVLSKHLKDGQVKTQDLRANAVNAGKVADSSLGGDDVGDGSLTGADVKDGSIAGVDLALDSVDGSKVRDDSLTGADVNESTLGQVPDAAKVAGKAPTAFIASQIYKAESAVSAGTALGDGTFAIAQACNPGDILLSGGPANIAATSTLLESFPAPGTTNAWTTRINKNAQTDAFSVVVLCANQ